jgi:hypothetical protein
MPASQDKLKIQEDGQEKEAVILKFTNGAKTQLEELKNFLHVSSELEVIKFGISVLENYKNEKKKKETESGTK